MPKPQNIPLHLSEIIKEYLELIIRKSGTYILLKNLNLADAYNNRGIAYYMKGNMGRAISDFQKACDMGNENGCKNLHRALRKR